VEIRSQSLSDKKILCQSGIMTVVFIGLGITLLTLTTKRITEMLEDSFTE